MADANKTSPSTGNQGSKGESLEDLMGQLSKHINSSDWLTHNTTETFAAENPEVAKAFQDAAAAKAQNAKDGEGVS